MKKVNLIIDVARCHDCNNCFISCKDEHWDNDHSPIAVSTPRLGHRWMDILNIERGQYPLQDVCYLPKPCMHCEDAPCIRASRDGAVYRREDGIVIIDPVKAQGQKEIVDSCPYRAIYWNDEKAIAQKCTMCAHLLDKGWAQPRCSHSCATGAMEFALLEDLEMEKRVAEEKLEHFHPEYQTRPRVWYKNLYRFTKCHIAGSVAIHYGLECAVDAKVTVTHVATQATWSTRTNNYGNFKLDGFDRDSGDYQIEAEHTGITKACVIRLKESLNIGVIHL
ncbi:4Fe-4S dicluster domain-containing protein [Holophaga foetida]|uniref:4Fe-4S dicluster domain-containing protein n=1 Tax=Holophaga foetida TaxID=35839 RepID=UPI0002475019|nr:4Fe-4S dicluster domain-containing protein [Holophaga foetida]